MKQSRQFARQTYKYWKRHGSRALLKRVKSELKYRFSKTKEWQEQQESTPHNLFFERFSHAEPINFIRTSRGHDRLNLVTDSLEKHSLFGGVGTSLILASLYAKRYDVPLRIITRTTDSNPREYLRFLDLIKIQPPKQLEFFSDYDRKIAPHYFKLDTSDKDIYLTTSWWSTHAVNKINTRKNLFYILQDVETFFYPQGDELFFCENVLKRNNIQFFINSKLLFDFYSQSGFQNIKQNGMFFEPAFPDHMYFPGENAFRHKKKRKLFFYSRPNHPRNLFYSGLNFLDEAIMNGIIDSNEWDVYLAGANLPSITFSNGLKPKLLGNMSWRNYLDFIREIDVAFCLMCTPHPSYPPLDVVASGGITLTNKFANKQMLDYSQNIICEELDSASMMQGFSKAIALAKNTAQRQNNFLKNNIIRNWETSFESVLEKMHVNK